MKRIKRRGLKSSNVTVVFSISLVLFLLGVIGLFMLNSDRSVSYMLEKLKMNIFLEDVAFKNKREELKKEHEKFISTLNLMDFTKRTRYISKEEASEEFERENQNLDIDELFDENILPASVELTLHRKYYEPSKVDSISKLIEKNSIVTEATIDSDIVLKAYNNIKVITFWVIGFSLLFLLISIVLINNYIKLRIFSKRFLIKTMQLVGAKKSFIIKPFLKESLWLGLLSAFLACIPLIALQYSYAYYVLNTESLLAIFQDPRFWAIIGSVFLIGAIITTFSTLLATWRYLNSKTDELYYF